MDGPEPYHFGRNHVGNVVERGCGCVLAPCGLVDSKHNHFMSNCEDHGPMYSKQMRQLHMADKCPELFILGSAL